MYTFLILIFLSIICKCFGECPKGDPFFMKDQKCANFNDICIKSDNAQCKTLLDACQQCPPTNITLTGMLEMGRLIAVNRNLTKELLEKNMENLKGQLLARVASMEKKSDLTLLFLWIIIILFILLLLIMILEVRFKCLTRCCEIMTHSGAKRKYRNLKTNKYKNPLFNFKLGETLTELDKKFESKLDHILQELGRVFGDVENLVSRANEPTIPKLINSSQLFLFKESENLMKVVAIEKGTLVIDSIFDQVTDVKIDYTNVDLVSSVKQKLGKQIVTDPDDIMLFCNNKHLDEKMMIFQIETEDKLEIKYCHFMTLDKVEVTSDVITKGDFSHIMEGIHPWLKTKVILKRYPLKDMSKLRESQAFVNELITSQLTRKEAGFVKLSGVIKDKNFFYIAMEPMVGGSLKDYIAKHPSSISKIVMAKWAKQILESLKFLHSHDIIHRNVKPSNILIDKDENLKLSSFGVSKYVQGGDKNFLVTGFDQSMVGTFRYMAPEVFQGKYGNKVDVWSFGTTMVEIATGKCPNFDLNEMKAVEQVSKHGQVIYKLEEGFEDLRDFIDSCLVVDPANRPKIDKLLQHKFIANNI